MATTSAKDSITEIRKVVNVANALRLASVCVLCYTFGSFMSNLTDAMTVAEEPTVLEIAKPANSAASLVLSTEKLEIILKVADLVAPKVKPSPGEGLLENAQFNQNLKLAKTAELISLASTPGNPVHDAIGDLGTTKSTKDTVDLLAHAYKAHKASKDDNANLVEQHIASSHLLDR